MKYFFATLLHIDLLDFEKECLEIMPGLILTNDSSKLDEFLNEDIKALIGGIEYTHITNSKAILYFEYEEEDIEKHYSDFNNLQLLNLILLWVDDFLKNSWVLKDNSVVCDNAYLIDGPEKENAECSSQRLNYTHTLSEGGIDKTTFSKTEIKKVMEMHEKIESYLADNKSMSMSFSMAKNYSRIGRFSFFVKYARESRNLGHKILNYCSALETLFSTDNTEISHKIGERIAYFLTGDYKKIDTYKAIKKAYTVRSKLTHGANIDNKSIEELPDLSKEIDDILRTIMNKIMMDEQLISIFESNNQLLSNYFNELLFAE
jgi:hypothetical protein